jgi:hypothetical protein
VRATMARSMSRFRYIWLLAVVITATLLSSCGDEEKAYPVRTYNMGERITLGHVVYVVYETQWLTHLGDQPDARVPQNRFFLVRLSAVNASSNDITVPTFSVEDDTGNSYPELSDGANVPQYIGYLRKVRPAESAQGHALFDAPPRHYKLRIKDEDGEKSALVDIPLSFTSESPEVPDVAGKKNDKK